MSVTKPSPTLMIFMHASLANKAFSVSSCPSCTPPGKKPRCSRDFSFREVKIVAQMAVIQETCIALCTRAGES